MMDRFELMDAAAELCEGLTPEECRAALVENLGQQAVDKLTRISFPYPFDRHVYSRKVVETPAEAVVMQAIVPPTVRLVTRLASEFDT
ncbi:hypothetical protein HYW35_01910 [Candidatus Saccharibacteria bacterium]|nr:hypothetical protein [Candidatus Saccharibacteria bacterium]